MASTRNLRHGKLIIRDGTPTTPNEIAIAITDGDLEFVVNKNNLLVRNRGKIDHKRDGDEVEMDIKFSFKFEQWQNSAANTGVSPVDALLKQGGASTWVSTGASCGPYAFDLVFQIKDPCSTTAYEQLVFTGVTIDNLTFKEGSEADTVSVAGKAQISTPVRTWSA